MPSYMANGPSLRRLPCWLGRFFGNSAQFWMGLQNQYDLETAGNRLAGKLDEVAAYRAAASG